MSPYFSALIALSLTVCPCLPAKRYLQHEKKLSLQPFFEWHIVMYLR